MLRHARSLATIVAAGSCSMAVKRKQAELGPQAQRLQALLASVQQPRLEIHAMLARRKQQRV